MLSRDRNGYYNVSCPVCEEDLVLNIQSYLLDELDFELECCKCGFKGDSLELSCPMCDSDLDLIREIAYGDGECYFEFDCTACDFTGRIRKGNLFRDGF